MYFNPIKPELFDNSDVTSDVILPVWNSPETYNRVIEHIDRNIIILDGRQRVYSENLEFDELLLALNFANLNASKKLSIKEIQLKTLGELLIHLEKGNQLYSKICDQYLEMIDLEWGGENPPTFYTMPDGSMVVDWFYSQMFGILVNGAVINEVNTVEDILGEDYWQKLNDEEKLAATSCFLEFASNETFMIRRVKTDDESQILFEWNPAFDGEDG